MNSIQLNISPEWLELNFGIIGIWDGFDKNSLFIYINKKKYKIVISDKKDKAWIISGWT